MLAELDGARLKTSLTEPETLSKEELAWLLQQVPVLRDWANRLEAYALSQLLRGQAVPGFKLVRGRTNRAWALPEEEVLVKLDAMGLPLKLLTNTSLVSATQAEKLIRGYMRNAGREIEWKDFNALVHKPEGKLTIASEEDPRPPVEAFGEFTDQPVSGDDHGG